MSIACVMHRLVSSNRRRWSLIGPALVAPLIAACTTMAAVVTNLHQFHGLVVNDQFATVDARLNGVICWESPRRDLVVLQDASGAALMEMDSSNPHPRVGDVVQVAGRCTGVAGGGAFVIGRTLVVSNERYIPGQAGTGETFLAKGSHPIRVTWFNRQSSNHLNVSYEGPGIPRQRLPDTVLFSGSEPSHGTNTLGVQGLRWRSFAGSWLQVPDFTQLAPTAEGITNNFDVSAAGRKAFVAVQFDGWLTVPETGPYKFYTVSSGGSQVFVGLPKVVVLGATNPPQPRSIALGQILPPHPEGVWSRVAGEIDFIARRPAGGCTLILKSGTGTVRVEVAEDNWGSHGLSPGTRVQATGICWSSATLDGHRIPGLIWVPEGRLLERGDVDAAGSFRDLPAEPVSELGVRTILEIKHLKREEAMRGHEVKIRGIVTWAARSAVVLQDSTSGIFVDEVDVRDNCHLRVGEYWEVEGRTVAQFSPMVRARRVTRLGRGILPEPVRPTWDQLMNGSLDALYVELNGIITAVTSNKVTLLTHDGKLQAHLTDFPVEEVSRHAGALVRLRGCLWAVKDETTHMFRVGEVQLHSAMLQVDEPPPQDPFLAPVKRAAELRLFDAQAAGLKQVRVIGQVIHSRGGRHYLIDGTNSLCFVPRNLMGFEPGDLVEVVGFPELGGPFPVLRESLARQIGHSALPEPHELPDNSWPAERIGTRVRIRAMLVSSSKDRDEQVLGLQANPHVLTARIPARFGVSFPTGSRLELTGTFLARRPEAAAAATDSFELLLNSSGDVRLLSRPAWSSLRQLVIAVAVLVSILLMALIWITLLRRQVEQRTAQLRLEIQERERTEQLRALEAERARIARDLHDDLGSSLTEITLLADAGPGQPPSLEKATSRFQSIGSKARALVKALDVIVWLVNPSRDALPFLAGYLGSYAEDYLAASGIGCKLRIPVDMPPLRLSANVRHNLFLAVKESLHNVVRHAHASEVQVEFAVGEDSLSISLTDNGHGFDSSSATDGNGLVNLEQRLTSVGGWCEVLSRRGGGTKVHLRLPLPNCQGDSHLSPRVPSDPIRVGAHADETNSHPCEAQGASRS